MKRYLLGLVLILFAFESKSQIATYDFTGTLGSQISQPPTSVIANVTATDITRGSGINPNAGANSINSRDWEPTFDANDYYEFIITPSANYTINLTNLSIQFQKSATGPNNYEIRTKVGANAEVTQGTGTFGTAGTASVGVISTSPVLGVVPSSTAVRFRIYAYGSSNTTGTLRLTSPLTLSGTAPLPITLISFNAALSESNQTTLKWATAKEFDNSYFEIERSKNSLDFESLGKIKGTGTSELRNDYSFTDESPLKGINYYRLKQVDFDGTFSYTRPVSVIKEGDGTISLYPNPVNNVLKVNFEDTEQIESSTIYNSFGNIMKTVEGSKDRFEITNLPQGKYIIQIRLVDGRIISNSFIKN